MRTAACLLLVVSLASCGGPGKQAAAKKTTTTTSPATPKPCATPPTLPKAADGSPPQVLSTVAGVQIAVVDHGASVDVVSLFVRVGCTLEPATLAGVPAALPIGGTVTHGDGLVCSNGRFEVRTATSDDGATYQATIKTYRLSGTTLVEVDQSASTIEAQQQSDELSKYYRLDCRVSSGP